MGKYTINVARRQGYDWQSKPAYVWFCTIDAGDIQYHATEVAQTTRSAFPWPEYDVTLQERQTSIHTVEVFE